MIEHQALCETQPMKRPLLHQMGFVGVDLAVGFATLVTPYGHPRIDGPCKERHVAVVVHLLEMLVEQPVGPLGSQRAFALIVQAHGEEGREVAYGQWLCFPRGRRLGLVVVVNLGERAPMAVAAP